MPIGIPGSRSGPCHNHPYKIAVCKGLCGTCYKKSWWENHPSNFLKHSRRHGKKCVRCNQRKSYTEFPEIKRKIIGDRLAWNRVCKACSAPDVLELFEEETTEKRSLIARLRKHHISRERYNTMLSEQGGLCAICQKRIPEVIDHNHACCKGSGSCGRCVRGLLCKLCNSGIGSLGDSREIIMSAADYVCRS